jgi:aminoglycoside 6'-N-acetyltransferase I
MIIRPARDEDRAEWLRLRQRLWPDAPEETHRMEIGEILAERETNQALVAAREAGGLAGFLEASLRKYADGCETSPVGYIEGWYVDPDARRSRVGSELVKAAEAWAIRQGCREMASDCLIDNTVSLKAHLSLGYTEVERAIRFCKRLQT